jgi:lipopolysaccharide transport system permease protein
VVSYLAAIWRCRYFWLSLVKMDLETRYRRSVLGLGWSLLHPIALTLIVYTVFHTLFRADLQNYALYVLTGLIVWNYLTSVTTQGCQCFLQAEAYIRQYPTPLAVFPLRTALGGMIHLLLAMAVVLAVAAFTDSWPGPVPLVSLVPGLLLLFALAWSMALLAGFANVLFRDTEHLVQIAFQILFYATPIIYPAEMLKDYRFGWIMQYHPLAVFLSLVREPVYGRLDSSGRLVAQVPNLTTYAIACGTLLLVSAAAAFVLNRLQRQLIFYL